MESRDTVEHFPSSVSEDLEGNILWETRASLGAWDLEPDRARVGD